MMGAEVSCELKEAGRRTSTCPTRVCGFHVDCCLCRPVLLGAKANAVRSGGGRQLGLWNAGWGGAGVVDSGQRPGVVSRPWGPQAV